MAKTILICGEICSGKTTYAKRVARTQNAVILSCDEIILAILGNDLKEDQESLTNKIKEYLMKKTVEISSTNTTVILDWGFCSRAEREATTAFFRSNGIKVELHYIEISKTAHAKNIENRNLEFKNGDTSVYPVDNSLLSKSSNLFEKPSSSEVDVLFKDNRG